MIKALQKEEESDIKEVEKIKQNGIVTTEEELEGFEIVKNLIKNTVNLERISYKDSLNYFSIIMDENIQKNICRLYFNRKQKYIGFTINRSKYKKFPIIKISNISKYKNEIIERVKRLK